MLAPSASNSRSQSLDLFSASQNTAGRQPRRHFQSAFDVRRDVPTDAPQHEIAPSTNGHKNTIADSAAVPASSVLQATAVLDGMGRASGPLLVAVAKQVHSLEVGELLKVVTDDPAAREELITWCRMTGNELVDVVKGQGYASYYVQRAT